MKNNHFSIALCFAVCLLFVGCTGNNSSKENDALV